MIRQKLAEVQEFMGQTNLDGWLVFDFRGSNPFAGKVFQHGGSLLTRRWFLWIPKHGQPQVLVHDIEFGSFPRTGYDLRKYNSREALKTEVANLLGSAKTVAMEYSPNGNNPYVSKVDAGTLDMVRSLSVSVVSSGDLLQLFLAWTPEQLANHRKASEVLTETKDAALAYLKQHIQNKQSVNEYQLQQYMESFITAKGMQSGHAPIIGFGPGSGDPHYVPSATKSKTLEPGDAVLMDLWCKAPGDNPYADITWMAFYGTPTEQFMKVFNAVLAGRDAGLALLQERLAKGQNVQGYEVDNATRQVLIDDGYEKNLKHRTGHSLGNVITHGDAAHFDGFETLEERQVLPSLGFTIEPGVYFPEFGVRSEINIYSHKDKVEVTTAIQREIDLL
jgi:Xaa-Pro aminopeptidase